MRNRAKCKKCNDIIESFHSTDYVDCKCGAISVCGGDAMLCAYRDIDNFMRVDDEGNEIVVKEIDKTEDISSLKPDRRELLQMLDDMIKGIEELPRDAKYSAVTHSDFSSVLLLLSSLFKSFDTDS